MVVLFRCSVVPWTNKVVGGSKFVGRRGRNRTVEVERSTIADWRFEFLSTKRRDSYLRYRESGIFGLAIVFGRLTQSHLASLYLSLYMDHGVVLGVL